MATSKNFVVKNGLTVGNTEVIDASGNLTVTSISGDGSSLTNIPNSALDNSSVTINSSSLSLGGTLTLDTDDIGEGATNKYFADSLARGSISVSGDLAYDSGTGVISFTERTDSEVRGLLSAGGDLSYDSGTGVISFTERTDSEVRGLVSVTDSGGDGSLSYSNSTGVITYTGPSASEVRAHFSGGTGVTITNGEVAIGQSVGTSDSVTFANITTSGYLRGPASFTIDPAAHGDDTGTVVIAGNLQVDGTTTTINSTTMTVDDLNIVLASGAANAAAANGAGITIDGASASLTYSSSLDAFVFNKDVDINGGTIDGVTIGGSSAGAGSFTTLTASGDVNFDSGTLFVDASADAVGIGTSSPSAKFSVASSVAFGGTPDDEVRIARFAGSAATASGELIGTLSFHHSFLGNNTDGRALIQSFVDTNGYNYAPTNLVFSTAAGNSAPTEAMRIDSSGNVGIGTSSPDVLLDVGDSNHGSAGNTGKQIQSSQDFSTVYSGSNVSTWPGVQIVNHDDTANRTAAGITFVHRSSSSGIAGIQSTSDAGDRADIRFATRSASGVAERVIIDYDGNVGIGTSSPSYKLHVSGTGYVSSYLTAGGISADTSSALLFRDGGGSEAMRIDSAGNVGIGTSSPSAMLHISDSADVTQLRLTRTVSGTSIMKIEGSGYLNIKNISGAGIQFGTNNTDYRMIIDTNGNVGIGTSSPAAYLDVNYTSMFRGDAAAGSVVHTTTFRNTRNGTWNIARIEAEAGGQVWAGDLVFKTASSSFANTLVEHMRLDENGNLGIGRSSPAYRLDVSSPSTADNSVIAQFQPTTGSNGLTIRRYNVGADNDRTGLYFQNEGVINTRFWVDDTGDVRVSASTPTSDTDGTVVGTQTFTGTHIYKTDETDLEIGEAVCLVGKKIVRSSSAKSKTVAGIYAGESWKVVDSFGDKCRDADGQPVNGAGHAVIALGDTRFFQSGSSSVGVLVDGPVQAGDLLCTSSVPGRLTVQEDDLMHSYTVAKAMEDGDGNAPVYAYVYCG